MTRVSISIVLILLFAVACSTTKEVSPTLPLIPTEEISATLQSSNTPSSQTATITPLLPTPTPLPTISISNVKIILTEFVQENGGCKLPCILGLTPGLSTRSEVDAFAAYFRSNARETDDRVDNVNINARYANIDHEWGGVIIMFWDQNISIDIGIEYRVAENRVTQLKFSAQTLQYIENENITVKKAFGNPYYNFLLRNFTMQKILTTYGEPSQILIRPYPNIPGYPSPPAQYTFNFALYYPEQGFLIDYIVTREEQLEYYVGCPNQPYLLELVTWNPDDMLSVNEVASYITNGEGMSAENIGAFRSIEEVTSMSVTEFFSEFSKSDSKECVQTLKELWPEEEP